MHATNLLNSFCFSLVAFAPLHYFAIAIATRTVPYHTQDLHLHGALSIFSKCTPETCPYHGKAFPREPARLLTRSSGI